MKRIILHIDMNAYFASCAQIADPSLKGKPVAVGGKSNRSIITTASYEARKYGVKSAMPIFMAKELCPNLIIVPSDFSLYEKYTRLFVEIIKRYSIKIEMASIDECYVDMSEELLNNPEPMKVVEEIQDKIYNELGLPCSIGVAPNKFLAKMASDMKKPFGITVLRKRDVELVLWKLPIDDMFGVGKKTAAMLKSLGINTIGDFANYENDMLLKKKLGKGYFTLTNWAHGIDESEVSTEVEDLKSVGNSRTLEENTNDYQEIKSMISKLSKMVSERAKKDELYSNQISITIKYDDFSVKNHSKKLDHPTNEYEDIFTLAMHLIEKYYDSSRYVRLLGVTMQNAAKIDSFVQQLSLFNQQEKQPRDLKINRLIQNINKQIGKELVSLGTKEGGKYEK
ncbi:MAG: DNA polymerase IV [Bacilli bacterium]|nr:DNA polymerase IV [Bacilli bacterium]